MLKLLFDKHGQTTKTHAEINRFPIKVDEWHIFVRT
jgi:hypothetical protein